MRASTSDGGACRNAGQRAGQVVLELHVGSRAFPKLDSLAQERKIVIDGGDLKPSPPDRGQIMKLDLEGKILVKWSRFGNQDGQIYWGHDLAVGKDGAVYVGDVNHGMRVQKFIPR